LSVPTGDVEGDSKPAAVPTERTYEAKQKPTIKAEKQKEEATNTIFGHPLSKSAAAPAKTNAAAVAKAPAQKQNTSPPPPTTKAPPAAAASKPAAPKQSAPTATNTRPKSHPPKGKASVVCGCFGSLHRPLTNCLYCGRISCEREGYDFCPFCGMLVEQVSDGKGYVSIYDCYCSLFYHVVSLQLHCAFHTVQRHGNTRSGSWDLIGTLLAEQ